MSDEGRMKLRNKKTWEVVESLEGGPIDLYFYPNGHEGEGGIDRKTYQSLSELNADWEDYKPAEPLIKDEKIRKAVRAWAEANGFSVFRVNNQHFNYVRIHGVKDRYSTNGSSIEFMGTIAGAEKRTYEIAELCGEEEEE